MLWRVLHLVKSHYYGNVRVLEIMARWEQLDCLWHNNPTLFSFFSLYTVYCILPTLPFSILPSPWLTSITYCKAFSFSFCVGFFICSQQSYLVIKMKHYHVRAFALATFQLCLKGFLPIYLLCCWKIWYLASVGSFWAWVSLVSSYSQTFGHITTKPCLIMKWKRNNTRLSMFYKLNIWRESCIFVLSLHKMIAIAIGKSVFAKD